MDTGINHLYCALIGVTVMFFHKIVSLHNDALDSYYNARNILPLYS